MQDNVIEKLIHTVETISESSGVLSEVPVENYEKIRGMALRPDDSLLLKNVSFFLWDPDHYTKLIDIVTQITTEHSVVTTPDFIVIIPKKIEKMVQQFIVNERIPWFVLEPLSENKTPSSSKKILEPTHPLLHTIESHLSHITLTQQQLNDNQGKSQLIQAEILRQIKRSSSLRYQWKRRLKVIKKPFQPYLGKLVNYFARPMILPENYQKKPILQHPPTISIVTPSFNQGPFLERTLQSVLSQHYPALEYVVQDGGSTDETVTILKQYQTSLRHWESKKDNGQSHAINLGFKQVTGDIMAYLNSDDMLLTGCLHYVANYFMQHPEIDVVYGHRILIDAQDQEIGRWVMPEHDDKVLRWVDFIPQETLFWRRSIWEKIGGRLDENFQFAMDWDLLLRFQEAGARFKRLPRFLGAFRVHTQQKTKTAILSSGMKEVNQLRMRCHGRFISEKEIHQHVRFYLWKHVLYRRLYSAGWIKH